MPLFVAKRQLWAYSGRILAVRVGDSIQFLFKRGRILWHNAPRLFEEPFPPDETQHPLRRMAKFQRVSREPEVQPIVRPENPPLGL